MFTSQRILPALRAIGLVTACLFGLASGAHAEDPPKNAPKPAAPSSKPAGPSCKLDEDEIPRGGRLDVSGARFGQAPVVRIGGKAARILERRAERISVQVSADSDGGPVTVSADGKTAECGTLTIIGKNN